MSLYIPKMSDTPAITIPGLAANFEELDSHLADLTNPHSVTAAQVPYTSSIYDWDPGDVAAGLDVLAGSRIVDHNFDVVNPPNGYYARWENGLQVVFGEVALGSVSLSDTLGSVYASPELTVTLPAVFSTPVYAWHVNSDQGIGSVWAGLGSQGQVQARLIRFRLFGGQSLSTENQIISFFAIGRWK